MLLFEEENNWQKEWKDMPEFIQANKESFKSIVVHFETVEDLKMFSKLIGQNITLNTKGVFFPVVKVNEKEKFYYES